MKKRIFTAALTAVFLFGAFGTITVYAGGNPYEPYAKGGVTDEVYANSTADTPPPIIPEEPINEAQPEHAPLTPDGTGTVIDNVTNENGIEFFTITSAAGNVFFLIIDRHRDSENVYFLNAVTERDLMALAEESDEDWVISTTPPPIIPETAPTAPPVEAEPDPIPEPEEENGGGMGIFVVIVILVLGGGAAGYYFKIYKPKQDGAADDFDYEDDYSDETDPYAEDSDDWDIDEGDSDKGGE